MAKGFMKNGVFHPINNDSTNDAVVKPDEQESEPHMNTKDVEKLKKRD